MEKLQFWLSCFLAVLTISILPFLLQQIKVQKEFEHYNRKRHTIRDFGHFYDRRKDRGGSSGRDKIESEDSDPDDNKIQVKENFFQNLPVWAKDAERCEVQLVETIPDGVFTKEELGLNHMSMHEAWTEIFEAAETSIEIVSYHWGLQRGSKKGQSVFEALSDAVTRRGVKLNIIHTSNHTEDERYDTSDLMKVAPDMVAVRSISMSALVNQDGVLHSKLLVADRKHFYIGSANLSDRGLTKMKEMGVLVKNCPTLAQDAAILFQVYWDLGAFNKLPTSWPKDYSSKINVEHPLTIFNEHDGTFLKTFLGSSPPVFCPQGRTDDLTIIKHAISTADNYIYVAISDYIPMNIFGKVKRMWTVLDDLLREAVLKRDVTVRMILSERALTIKNRKKFLLSLLELNKQKQQTSVEIKVFHAAELSHFKSAHNKYFITDKLGYVGTSNWSLDYFTRTAGVGFVMQSVSHHEAKETGTEDVKDLRQQLVDVFLRDWESPHCRSITQK